MKNQSNESFLDDETACNDGHSIFGTRLIFSAEDFSRFGGSIRFNSKIVFGWFFFISLVMQLMGLPSPFLFYALVDFIIRFFDTDLSLLICLSVIEVKTEGNYHRD